MTSNSELSEQMQTVYALSENIMQENWDKLPDYLTDDLYYQVGSSPAKHGSKAVGEFFQDVFATFARFTGHQARKVWEEDGIITIEMDAFYDLVPSGEKITVACCDVYRFEGNKVKEWRVYADMSPWLFGIK